MGNTIDELRRELERSADEKTKVSTKRFFKEEIKYYGVRSVEVGRIAKEYYQQVRGRTKAEIFDICEELWKSGYIEESFIACNWSHNIHKKFETGDFKIFEKWVNEYVTNWASCDTFCNHTMGAFIEMYPGYLTELKRFARSGNRWMRRASAVSLIVPARKGKFLNDILEIADILLTDKDDMVQKGYGWMLKVASQAHQQEIFDYVISKKKIMPRTSLRYAIEKMPEELKATAMKK